MGKYSKHILNLCHIKPISLTCLKCMAKFSRLDVRHLFGYRKTSSKWSFFLTGRKHNKKNDAFYTSYCFFKRKKKCMSKMLKWNNSYFKFHEHSWLTECITVRPSVCALVALFLYTLWLSSSLFSKAETISGENNSNFVCMQGKLSVKNQ